MAKISGEKIFECEVKRRRKSAKGGYEPFWKLKNVSDALSDQDTEFRCKDCHGHVRVRGRLAEHGPSPHVEHLSKQDSEYCAGGMYFRVATDGRTARLSSNPVR